MQPLLCALAPVRTCCGDAERDRGAAGHGCGDAGWARSSLASSRLSLLQVVVPPAPPWAGFQCCALLGGDRCVGRMNVPVLSGRAMLFGAALRMTFFVSTVCDGARFVSGCFTQKLHAAASCCPLHGAHLCPGSPALWPGQPAQNPPSTRVPVTGQSGALGPHPWPGSGGTRGAVRTPVGGLVHGGKWRPFSCSPGQCLSLQSLFPGVTHSRLHRESQERPQTPAPAQPPFTPTP